MSIDLEKEGLVGDSNNAGECLPPEMMDEEFLNSPIGRIFQVLATLELAVKSFGERISLMEQYITYLLAKDPVMGPKITALAQAAKNAGIGDDKDALSKAVKEAVGEENVS